MHNSECLNEMEMERKETEPKVVQTVGFENTGHNETSQTKSNKIEENTNSQSKCRSKEVSSQQDLDKPAKACETLLLLGHCIINQVQMFTSSCTKMLLLLGQEYIYHMTIFTSVHHSTFQHRDI